MARRECQLDGNKLQQFILSSMFESQQSRTISWNKTGPVLGYNSGQLWSRLQFTLVVLLSAGRTPAQVDCDSLL